MRFPALITLLLCGALHGAPARHPSYEPVPPPSASVLPNLFLGAETRASGHWSGQSPDRAVDGDLDPASHWACENLPVWHQVNLPKATSLSSIRVRPYWGDGRVYQYKVEGSADGKSWRMLADKTANSITSTADGDLFQFDPVMVKHVRTTFLSNSRGAANGGHLVEIEGFAQAPETGLGGGIGDIDTRYLPQGPISGLRPPAEGIALHAWRGERVNAQVVVYGGTSHRALRFDPVALAQGSRSVPVSARFVRQTLANGKPQGDILDRDTGLDLPAGANRAVWLEIDVPSGTPPGRYTGTFTVRSDSSWVDFPISLEVLPATLPPPAEWSIHLDLWQHPDAVARWHDVEPWSDAHLALMKPLMRRLAAAGQKTITTTLIHEPWGGQTYDRFRSMVTWRKRANGSWHYDFTVFDRWVTFASEECGLGHARIHGYSMIPWSLEFRYFDEKSNSWEDVRLQPGTKEYDEFWGGFLRDFKSHLSRKGWLERARIAVDERPDHLVRGALDTIRKHAPELLVASAIDRPSDLNREMDDISTAIEHSDRFSRELLNERRAAGRKTTIYICTNPAVPNTFTFSPPAESEWLPLFAAANGFDGMLRWAYQSWVENPLDSTDFTSWPSGDCFLVYPGDRSSVRFERLRDGIESFEKIRLLRSHASGNAHPAYVKAMENLEKALEGFTWERGSKPGVHTEDVRLVNRALLEATRALSARNENAR